MMSETESTHHEQATAYAQQHPVRCAVLTISDTRDKANDASGNLICDRLKDNKYHCCERAIVRDDPQAITQMLEQWLARDDIDAIVTTGGTGMAVRDTTIEIIQRYIDKPLEGFGELFRMLSYEHVGAAAMLSRATAGLAIGHRAHGSDTFIFALPGSSNAVALAMDKLIIPELAHLVWERHKSPGSCG